MAALQNNFWDPIKMRLSDTMAVSVTSCESVHRILCTDIPVLSISCRPIPARSRFPAQFTQASDRRNVHKSGIRDHVEEGIRPGFLMATGKVGVGARLRKHQRRILRQNRIWLVVSPDPELILPFLIPPQ